MPIAPIMSPRTPILGIRANLGQFSLQLVQVSFVGLTLGMTRTVVPAVAEQEFGLPRNSAGLVVTFVIAFGVVKAVMNFLAGRTSERLGRKWVLVIGWLVALPIPFMIRYGPTWNWIVVATVLLGINQGLTWSMTITSKLDLTREDQRGLANGLNEFCGYFAVAVAGVVTATLSDRLGARLGLFIFGLAAIVPALMMALLFVRDTRPNLKLNLNDAPHATAPQAGSLRDPGFTSSAIVQPQTSAFFAICQAGLIEKFTDALVWIIFPMYLTSRGVELARIGWIPGVYAAVWGASQLMTGPLSDRIGRKPPIAIGMLMCSAGVALMLVRTDQAWWIMCAAMIGLGMGLLYPNLGAAVSDLAPPDRRGTVLGMYRFWRDLGYAIGALALGLIIQLGGRLEIAFGFVSLCMAISGLAFMAMAPETCATKGAARES